MQLVQLLFILVIVMRRASLIEWPKKINEPDGPPELEDAAIQILTSCYTNQTTTIAITGDSSSSFIERLSSHESFALVSLHIIIRSENAIGDFVEIDKNRQHKVDVFVVMAADYNEFRQHLLRFRDSLYDNPMALNLLIAWSRQETNAGCDAEYGTATFLHGSIAYNYLNTILICHHRTAGIMIYTSHPFEYRAPDPWRLLPFQQYVWGQPYFYFMRQYRVNEEICKNLAFDKTRDLHLSPMTIDSDDDEVVLYNNKWKSKWRQVQLQAQKSFGLINSFLSYVNARVVVSTSWVFGRNDFLIWDKYRVDLNDIRGLVNSFHYYAYPSTRTSTFLVSPFRGNKPQLSKILGVMDEYSWIGIFFVYLITLISFKYFVRQPLLVGILNLCRLTCSRGLMTLPRGAASQVYSSCLLFFIVTMQGIFMANLAALLTHDFPVRQVNSVKDVIELNYTVYAEEGDLGLFADPRFKGRIIRVQSASDCINYVKLDARSVCVAYGLYDKVAALESDLHVSTEYIEEAWTCNIVPWRWILLERFNAFQGILIAAGAAAPFQTMVEEKRLLEAEAIEVPSKPKVITSKDLRIAFIILGIGLACASISFIAEITIYRHYRRLTTTRVIVL